MVNSVYAIDVVIVDANEIVRGSSEDVVDPQRAIAEVKLRLNEALSAGREYKEEQLNELRHQAQVAYKIRDYIRAEEVYLKILTHDLTDDARRQTLLDMVDLYERSGNDAKQAAVLEKLSDVFPYDPVLPQVFIKLGLVYRNMGLYKLALARFYSVLNHALRIDESQIEEYRKLSIRAQLEIADTHFKMGSYMDAMSLYEKLRMLDIAGETRAYVVFQIAYCEYLLQEDAKAVASFKTFIKEYPGSSLVAEATFLLSNTYSRMGRLYEASRMVLELLKRQSADKESEEWVYWQKRAGNQLANDLFTQGDYASALTIYQSLKELTPAAEWRWPILYQIGLCFEYLKLKEKAAEAYTEIIEWTNEGRDKPRDTALESKTLSSIYEMAQWKLDNLNWSDETRKELEKLLDKSNS